VSATPIFRTTLPAAFASALFAAPPRVSIERLPANPIITEKMLSVDDADSINGPSLIRVPPWVKNPLGKYYLYFAHHAGKYIRFAYANRLRGRGACGTAAC
jgi:hypothetical protein